MMKLKRAAQKKEKVGAAIRVGRAFKHAVVATALMVATIMPLKRATANEPVPEPPKDEAAAEETGGKRLSLRFMGGAYDKGETPFVGVGLSGGFDIGLVAIDAIVDGMFSDFKSMDLDSAELDITFPAGKHMAIMPFIYRSRYYGDVTVGAGAAFHFPGIDLHVAPHWLEGNVVPVPISWTPSFWDGRIGTMIGIVLIANSFALSEPAPIIGAEVRVSVKVAGGTQVYVRAFEMNLIEGSKMSVGVFNVQAGIEISP
jgi:hypothetical protein